MRFLGQRLARQSARTRLCLGSDTFIRLEVSGKPASVVVVTPTRIELLNPEAADVATVELLLDLCLK